MDSYDWKGLKLILWSSLRAAIKDLSLFFASKEWEHPTTTLALHPCLAHCIVCLNNVYNLAWSGVQQLVKQSLMAKISASLKAIQSRLPLCFTTPREPKVAGDHQVNRKKKKAISLHLHPEYFRILTPRQSWLFKH